MTGSVTADSSTGEMRCRLLREIRIRTSKKTPDYSLFLSAMATSVAVVSGFFSSDFASTGF